MFFVRNLVRFAGYVSKRDPKLRVLNAPVIAADKLSNLPNREFSIFLAEAASIYSVRSLGLSGLLHAIESRKNFLTSKEVFRITAGLCRLSVINNQGVIPLILACLSDGRMDQLLAHELAYMAVQTAACTRRADVSEQKRQEARVFVQQLSYHFQSKIEAASFVDLANMSTGVSDLELKDEVLFDKIAEKSIIQIGLFKGPDLADILMSFAWSGVHHARLVSTALPHLMKRMPVVADVQLLQLATVYVSFSDLIETELSGRFMDRYIAELSDKNRTFSDVPREILIQFSQAVDALNLKSRLHDHLLDKISSL